MEQRASQLIGCLIVMSAPDKLNARSGRRNWQSLLPLFEIARVLVRRDHVAR
jgi:hypothetical protein